MQRQDDGGEATGSLKEPGKSFIPAHISLLSFSRNAGLSEVRARVTTKLRVYTSVYICLPSLLVDVGELYSCCWCPEGVNDPHITWSSSNDESNYFTHCGHLRFMGSPGLFLKYPNLNLKGIL